MTKLEKAYEAYRGDKLAGLRLVAKFPNLGEERDAIKLAVDCLNNPSFYKQIGKDIKLCIERGVKAIEEKYKWGLKGED